MAPSRVGLGIRTPREGARLQGLPEWFDFGSQSDKDSYKQLGNGVAVGAAYFVFREHVRQNKDALPKSLVRTVMGADEAPNLRKLRLSVA